MDHGAVIADFRAARAQVKANRARLVENRTRLEATLAELVQGATREDRLRVSAMARLQARLDTLPVIEQAKGILICRSGCSPDEAFDILRRASQRTNVKVTDIAAQIVATACVPRPDEGESHKAG